MHQQIPTFPARYYVKLLDILLARGMNLDEILSEIQIDFSKYLTVPDLKVTQEQVRAFIHYCLKFPKNHDLAFELGKSLKVSSHHLVGYALLTSDDLEHAVLSVCKYFTLIMPSFKLSSAYHADGAMELICEPIIHMDTLTLNFHLEAIAVALHCAIQELVESSVLTHQIFISIPEPLHAQKYQQLHQVKFHFNVGCHPCVKVILSQQLIQQKLRLADEATRQLVELKCQEQIYAIKTDTDLTLWLKQLFLNTSDIPSLQDCAQLLNISTKTLQRHLKAKNTSYQKIKNEIMLQKSQQLLIQSQKTIIEIAMELGYASASNFSRSFKMFTGLAPDVYRKKNTS